MLDYVQGRRISPRGPKVIFEDIEDMESLMELDVIQDVLQMGFPLDTVKNTMLCQLAQVGMPFVSTEDCIKAMLHYMEQADIHPSHIPPPPPPPLQADTEVSPSVLSLSTIADVTITVPFTPLSQNSRRDIPSTRPANPSGGGK